MGWRLHPRRLLGRWCSSLAGVHLPNSVPAVDAGHTSAGRRREQMTTGEQDEWTVGYPFESDLRLLRKGQRWYDQGELKEYIVRLERENQQMRNKAALVDELLSNYDVDAFKLGDVSCDYCGAELQREPHRVLDKWMADRPELIGLMCPVARYNAIEEEDK